MWLCVAFGICQPGGVHLHSVVHFCAMHWGSYVRIGFLQKMTSSCPGLSCRTAVPYGSSSFGFGGFALCWLLVSLTLPCTVCVVTGWSCSFVARQI